MDLNSFSHLLNAFSKGFGIFLIVFKVGMKAAVEFFAATPKLIVKSSAFLFRSLKTMPFPDVEIDPEFL